MTTLINSGPPSDRRVFRPDDPLEVYALLGAYAILGIDTDLEMVGADADYRAKRRIIAHGLDDAAMPALSARLADGMMLVTTGEGGEIALDWWMRRPGVPFDWRPWAGRLKLDLFPEFMSTLSEQIAGQQVLDVMRAEGYGYHDWSGLDRMRTVSAADVGFSPNQHSEMRVLGRPVATALAFVGLGHLRFLRVEKQRAEYGFWCRRNRRHWYSVSVVHRSEYLYSAGNAYPLHGFDDSRAA